MPGSPGRFPLERCRSLRRHCVAALSLSLGFGLVTAFLPQLNSGPALAQDVCQAAIQGVRGDIEERLGAVVSNVETKTVQQWRGDRSDLASFDTPFNNADQIVVFNLASDMGRGTISRRQGQAAENIMRSSQLTRSYADRIIKACDPVASVKFFYWEWFQGWSLFPRNDLRQDECVVPTGPGTILRWGQNICL